MPRCQYHDEKVGPGSVMLPVVETFHSLQGEGLHTGRSAFFIRLAGCTVGCSWCDTKHSWPETVHPLRSLVELATEAQQAADQGAAFIVVTGGEPLHHDLDPLSSKLRETIPLPIHLETSGVDSLSGSPDWITLSPKRHAPPRQELLDACDELKVIVHEQADLEFAGQMAEAVCQSKSDERVGLLVQPGWESPKGIKLAIDFVKSNSDWRLSLQTHKWLGLT